MMSGLTKIFPGERASNRAAEAAARANEIRTREGRELQSADSSFSTPGGAGSKEGGQPLMASQRSEMEARFGRDFSNVRVHSNSAEAEVMGARAFTRGNDISFAPGESPEIDRSLLAHELTHSVQQAESGVLQVQMDPKKEKRGIGSAPPEEPFDRSDQTGPEDDAVLFNLNEASLSSAGVAALKKIAAEQKGPVLVEIHGYASSEGEPEYNVNLSAHRAAAVKAELLRLLPKDSQVQLYAHGETTAFGAAEKNRRTGIKVMPLPAPPHEKKAGDAVTPDPTGGAARQGAHLDPSVSSVRLMPHLTLGDPPLLLKPPTLIPPLAATNQIDWLVLRSKWASYGLHLDARTAGDIEGYAITQRNASIGFFSFLGADPVSAAKLADSLLPIAIGVATSAYLSDNFPNHIDLMDRDIKATYPDSWKTPQIPITDIIDFVYQKSTGKDNKYLTRF